jgi:hypothetical protein
MNQRSFFMKFIMPKHIIFSDEYNNQLRTYVTNKGDVRIEVGKLLTDSMEVECIYLSIEDAKDLVEVLQSEINLAEQ